MNTFLTAGIFGILTGISLAADWPAWRGPTADGISTETDLPTKWSKTENVKWRVPLPEPGNSTPIVSRGRVFVTQAEGERRELMCFDRKDGKLLWKSGVTAKQKDPTHGTNPYCSASPVTDGERVIASFASEGLVCYDFDGKELWKREDLGKQIHIWGNGASPVIHGDMCFLNFGPGETTYLLAVDKKTGKTVWKHDEETGYGKPAPGGNGAKAPTYIGSWSTPVILKTGAGAELLMSWPRRLASYDPATGKELWSTDGLNPLVYTNPIVSGQTIVAMGGFNGSAIAVSATGKGPTRLWQNPRTPQRIGSGVIRDGHVYIHNDPGMAQCLKLDDGSTVWQERLKGPAATAQNWSSVMLAGENCYTINQGGDCFVFKAKPAFELVSVNSLGERSNSSIVPSDGQLFIRTHQALWCVGK